MAICLPIGLIFHMDEVFALKKILNLTVGSEFDLIVFDTVPTGHTLKALTCPEAIEGFILRILRMRAKIMNLKGFMMRRNDDLNPFVDFLENTRNLMLRIRELIRNPSPCAGELSQYSNRSRLPRVSTYD